MITNKLYKIIGIECEHNDDFVRVRYYDERKKLKMSEEQQLINEWTELIEDDLGDEFSINLTLDDETIIITIYDKLEPELKVDTYKLIQSGFNFDAGYNIDEVMREIYSNLFYFYRKKLKGIIIPEKKGEK